jgi:hypothetical protein
LKYPHTVHVIVNATNRKSAYPGVNLGDLNAPDGGTLFKSWSSTLDSYRGDRVPVMDLYAGDHWCIAKSLISGFPKLAIRLWVISPGYGLISAEDNITPYVATFSPDHYESVCRASTTDLHQANRNWWNELVQWQPKGLHRPRSISELRGKYLNDSFIIVCSTRYLNLLRDDLVDLGKNKDADLSRLHIASSRGGNALGQLAENLVPSGRKLLSILGGGDASLNIRTAKLILTLIDQGTIDGPELRRHIREILEEIPRPTRRRVKDNEVDEFIVRILVDNPETSLASCLRQFRESNNACGEKRFRRLFELAKDTALH